MVPFLGAGASFVSRPSGADWTPGQSTFLPSGRELSNLREVLSLDVPCGDLHRFLAEVPAPLVIVATNYDNLIEKAFQAAGKPYDLVIHPADRKDIAAGVLWWPHGATEPVVRDANKLSRDIDLAKTTVIYKMHGTLDPSAARDDNFVITEEDYGTPEADHG